MNDLRKKYYAIVPAAGRSRRMGQPKLLLPWRDGKLIDQVLGAWTASRVVHVVVVARRDDVQLHQACQQWSVEILQPDKDPPDMKASVQIGLRHLESQFHPADHDRCFIAPADLPTLTTEIIDRMIDTPSDDSTILVPQFGDKHGHPILLPWPMTAEVFLLGEDEGINKLVDRHPKLRVEFAAAEAVRDVDTPEDYESARRSDRRSSE